MSPRRVVSVPVTLLLAAGLGCGDVLGQSALDGQPAPTTGLETSGGEVPLTSNGEVPPAASCLEALSTTGAVFTVLAASAEPPALDGCGMVDGVSVSRGPTGIQYRPPIRVSCAFARALPSMEAIVQSTANEVLGEPVTIAKTMGSYGCRTIQSVRSPGRLSEHAFGNAIDVGEWWTRGVHAVVVRDFRREEPEGRMLRALAERLRASGAVGRLLDPDYDAAHRNHFHLEGPGTL